MAKKVPKEVVAQIKADIKEGDLTINKLSKKHGVSNAFIVLQKKKMVEAEKANKEIEEKSKEIKVEETKTKETKDQQYSISEKFLIKTDERSRMIFGIDDDEFKYVRDQDLKTYHEIQDKILLSYDYIVELRKAMRAIEAIGIIL